MAGEWLKMECATPDKPEVLALTVRMGWDDPDLTVGKLFRLWRWFDQQTTDGNATSVTPALLDRIVGVAGFCDALSSVGWLRVSPEGITLPNFDKHNGNTAKNRAETAKRVANHRANKATSAPAERGCLPRPVRASILARDGHKCVYCRRKEGEYAPPETARDALLCVDHVIPVAQGGTDDPNNLVAACGACNQFKSDRRPDQCGLTWPVIDGKRAGNEFSVTPPLAREEKKRKEKTEPSGSVERASKTCPDSFVITEELRQWAWEQCPGVDVDRETERMRDHTYKTARSDWTKAWRNWMRGSFDRLPKNKPTTFSDKRAEQARAFAPGIAARTTLDAGDADVLAIASR